MSLTLNWYRFVTNTARTQASLHNTFIQVSQFEIYWMVWQWPQSCLPMWFGRLLSISKYDCQTHPIIPLNYKLSIEYLYLDLVEMSTCCFSRSFGWMRGRLLLLLLLLLLMPSGVKQSESGKQNIHSFVNIQPIVHLTRVGAHTHTLIHTWSLTRIIWRHFWRLYGSVCIHKFIQWIYFSRL